jgi:hypothetical protein
MDFKFWNKTLGWTAFTIALVCYFLTLEQYVPLWDCGEYISTAYKLEVGHPPGAPTFNMLGAVFTYFLPTESVAMMINFISALCAALTILFMFWTITYLGKRLALMGGGELSDDKKIAILGSSLIGALAYAFTDSFWFSAVEGEVYAMSSFFTALVVWAIFKWDEVADEPYADRWLIFIMYMIGLSIGVHLLNLLAIPAVGMMYYFRRYKPNTKGGIIAFIISLFVLGIIQMVIIPGMAKWPAKMELLFVNDLGLPFSFGSTFFFLLVIGLIIWGIRVSERKQKHMLNMAVMTFMVILIGFSCFAMIMIRSQANTPVDENNPETFPQLLSYLNRDQYGSAPLVSGNYWNSEQGGKPEDGDPVYMPGFAVKRGDQLVKGFRSEEEAKKYIKENELANVTISEEYFIGDNRKAIEPVFKPEHTTVFPRMYSREDRHIRMYKLWSGYVGGDYLNTSIKKEYDDISNAINQMEMMQQKGELDPAMTNELKAYQNYKARMDMTGIKIPTFGENLSFFFNYQMGWMYFRYFLWNFAGRQSDEQNIDGNIIDGNWYTGISMIDSERLGDQSKIPSTISKNKAHNKFFFLPLILGLIGMIYHLLKAPKDWLIILLLFVFTGIAIIVYLNSKPAEPRERDYAYAGSFYAFAFWIGIGVYALFDMAKNLSWKKFQKGLLVGGGFGVLLYLIEMMTGEHHSFSYSILYMVLIGFGLIAGMIFIGGKLKNPSQIAFLSIALTVCVPVVLAYQGWDDHNRSGRSTARSFAKNFMRSCDKNAILFTYGDNDTFPLWYIQEVEGYRTDSRIVNTSLLGTDWYIDQMTRKAYDSEPVPFTIPEHIYRQGGSIDQFELNEGTPGVAIDLKAELKKQMNNPQQSKSYNANWVILSGKTFYINVNKANAIKAGLVPKGMESEVVDRIEFRVQDNVLMKNDFMILDLLANYDWSRPIYFATGNSSKEYLGLDKYFSQEGLAYKLVPIVQEGSRYSLGGMNIDKTYAMLMGTSKDAELNFEWGGMDAENANVDFYVRRTICTSYHTIFMALAGNLLDQPEMLNEKITQAEFRLRVIQDSLTAKPEDGELKSQEAELSKSLAKYRQELNKYDYKGMAKKVINRCFEVMPPENVPYDTYTQFFVELLFRAGDKENAIKHLKGHVEKAKEMLAYITNMEAIYASNDIIGIAAENYDIINSMFEMVDEEMLAGDLGKYVFATDDEVSKMMKSWIEKIQKEDREKIALIQLTLPRYFTKDAEYALDAILEKDIKEGSKQIKEAGQYFQLISNVAVFVFNSSSDQGTMQDMQRLMQMTQGKVSDWLRKIMAADPSKQQEIVDAFPDLFNRGGRAPASGGGSLGGSL